MRVIECLKRTISILLCLVMVFSAAPELWCMGVKAVAETTGHTTEFAGGSGTVDEPYLVSTSQHLNNVRKYLNAHFRMVNDINFVESAFAAGGEFYNGGNGWVPIGTANTPFQGVFNGDGHSISNIEIIGTSDYSGLFSANTGTIKNLNVSATISSTYLYTGGVTGRNTGTIVNCSFSGSISGDSAAGGIVGENDGNISNCINRGDITGQSQYIGGIAGRGGSSKSASISYCVNYSTVMSLSTRLNTSSVGGIAGAVGYGEITHCSSHGTIISGNTGGGIVGGSNGSVSFCYNTGEIQRLSTYSVLGGIVGYLGWGGNVSACYNAGKIGVDPQGAAGGIAGTIGGDADTTIINCYNTGDVKGSDSGGIFGKDVSADNIIKNCYTIGTIERYSLAEGIGGTYQGGVTNCYYLKTDAMVSGKPGKGCSLEEMKIQSTFTGFDFNDIWSISEDVNDGFPHIKGISETNIPEFSKPELDDPEVKITTNTVKQEIGDIQLGPYAIRGATINILGYEIPLINLEANITLDICDNLKIVADADNMIRVLIGFDEGAKANIDGVKNSTQYWSESYREVKSMYQAVTGQKVDTTRLWNKFSSMRGKLKKMNANMLVDVSAELTGYLEFQYREGELVFSEGGVLAAFNAKSSLRSYYGPCYVALGIEAGVDGSLVFTNEGDKINPEITVSPEFTLSAGGGIGTRSTYAQIDAYGTLAANIATAAESPFEAGIELGVRWMGYIIGKEIFSGSMSFASMELYPNFGDPWNVSLMSLTPQIDVSDFSVYNELINATSSIERDYLARPYSLRNGADYKNASFVKQNAYPLNSPNLVSFDDDTMLLVWIDDIGEKTDENMCSLMYSYFNGTEWSEPSVIYEDGTANDMPCVYSDGWYAYIVWQKASQVFGADVETSDMLRCFDLYATVFDFQTQTFTKPFCINAEDNLSFEFNPVIFGENGTFTVAWLENSDNNVYQMSGVNTLRTSRFDIDGKGMETSDILATNNMFTDVEIVGNTIYYSLLEDDSNNLYAYEDASVLYAEGINAFDYANGLLFYSSPSGFYAFDGNAVLTYENVGALDEFEVAYSNGGHVLFTPVLNKDFTKDIYYSTLIAGKWSDFEVYSNSGKYIRNYSPALQSDGAVYVAFNYVEEDMQSATVVVDQCTNEVDIVVEYVDFDDEHLDVGNLGLRIGIRNKGSTPMNSFMVLVYDSKGANLYSQEVSSMLSAFGEQEITVSYTVPDDYDGEIYAVQVLPVDYTDLNESNNVASTTFECIHDYSGTWVIENAPTQNANGVCVLRCLKCTEKLMEEEILRLKFAGASLSLQHNLAINYKVDKALFEEVGYTDPYVVFELNGVKTKVSSYTISGDRYIFTFRNIAPNQMNDTIKATLYATYDGVEYASATREYSVAEYCYSMLELYAADQYAELRTLLVELLNYGAASQTYTGYRTDALVNASLTDAQLQWGTSVEPALDTVLDTTYKAVESPTAKWKGAGLHLQEAVAMRLKFTAENVEGLTVKIESGESTWTISSDKFLEEDGVHYVYFTGLDAGQMRQSVYLTICQGDTPVSNTVCYSIGSYAYEKQNSTIAGLPELVKAMMKYGDSAYAYVH